MNERRAALMARAKIDAVKADRRTLTEIMGDEIPWEKWARQAEIKRRAGAKS